MSAAFMCSTRKFSQYLSSNGQLSPVDEDEIEDEIEENEHLKMRLGQRELSGQTMDTLNALAREL